MLEGGWQRARGRRRLAPGVPALLTGAGWAAGAATTVAVIGSPELKFGLRSPDAHLLLDTVDACVALLVTYLLWGRFRRSRRLQDMLLADGFLLLALAGIVPPTIAVVVGGHPSDVAGVWCAAAFRVLAVLLVAAGALVGRAGLVRVRRRIGVVAAVLALVAVPVALWWARNLLPEPLPGNPPASAEHPVITGHPALLAAQVVGAVAFAVASVAFARQASGRRDALLTWLGPACAVAAFARVSYFLFPSLYTDWVYTGDLLRTASYVLLLVGAAREIGEYWTGWATATVLDDRRRLARELHDGVVQELAYMRSVTQTGGLDRDDVRQDLLGACDRAIDEARAAVDALGRSPEEPLGFVLHRAARQVAERYGGHVLVDLDDSIEVPHAQRHALVRITREAVSNALRHGRAQAVSIRLERDAARCRLVVQDDGRGFDLRTAGSSTGFGLTSMRERAAALPGTCEICSSVGHGTSVTVTW
jgi:signal transduction histidine kinase